ncbi:hypothetical protein OUZ56_030351 [Daphnia magna]|uniref:Uncharacterized protein n=1 Tax=Daphnia magna TaxID=35525 RepID=A0ABQ9ZRL4_9CRUS|nr:hypothetical protein OUZ56_030351 [Daphnia magna]
MKHAELLLLFAIEIKGCRTLFEPCAARCRLFVRVTVERESEREKREVGEPKLGAMCVSFL